ncbi:hypothetical protein [Sphingopyxis fribergensis]
MMSVLRANALLTILLFCAPAGCSENDARKADSSRNMNAEKPIDADDLATLKNNLDEMKCKNGDDSLPFYHKFPFFLQNTFGSRGFYINFGESYVKRHGDLFSSIGQTPSSLRFDKAAQAYVDASEGYNKTGKIPGGASSRFASLDFQRHIFKELSENYRDHKAYAEAIQRLYASDFEARNAAARAKSQAGVAQKYPPSSPPPKLGAPSSGPGNSLIRFSELASASADPEIILLTSAINLSVLESSDKPINMALEIISGNEIRLKELTEYIEKNGCISCHIEEEGPMSWLPDSMKVVRGKSIWLTLYFYRMRQMALLDNNAKYYNDFYRSNIYYFYPGKIYIREIEHRARIKPKLLRDYYAEIGEAAIESDRICDSGFAYLVWDRDLENLVKHKFTSQ